MQKCTIPKPIFIIPDFTRSVSGTFYFNRGCSERHLVNVSQLSPSINDNVSVHQCQLNAGPESQTRLKMELQAPQEINIF